MVMHTLQKTAAFSLGRQMRSPPLVSAEYPCISLNIVPHAFATLAILAMMGRLWITKETGFFWLRAKFWNRFLGPVSAVIYRQNVMYIIRVKNCAFYVVFNVDGIFYLIIVELSSALQSIKFHKTLHPGEFAE
jgi:hypothetical protein